MPDNLETPASGSTPVSTNSSAAGKPATGKKKQAVKKVYGKMSFRLPLALEQALILASVQLQIAGEENYTVQEQIEQAVDRFTDYLQIKKNVELLGVVPKKPAPSK
jgi:predicted DNA-binding protein